MRPRRHRALAVGAAQVRRPDELESPAFGRVGRREPTPWPSSAPVGPAAAQALGQLDYAGTLVFVGTGSEPIPVNHNRMIILELEALGTYNYSADGFQPALDLLDGGALPLDLLIEPDDVPSTG